MKCVISCGNVKILARAIHMLSKVGDEMYVQPQEDFLSLRSVNASNSAYSDITFKQNFFSYYALEDGEQEEDLRCKILLRSIIAVFKTPATLDKQVESCHIKLEANSEKLCLMLKYKNSVTKTHLLPILDTETIKATYRKEETSNHLCIQPSIMTDVVQNFKQNLLEVTLEVLQEKVLIRNYVDDSSNISNETRTQLAFGVGEFDEYTVGSDTTITFCLKELRAILTFAEHIAQPINIHFDDPGRPAVFILKSSTFETNLVLATLNPGDSQTETSSISVKPVPKKAPVRRNYTRKGVKSLSKKSISDPESNDKTTEVQEENNACGFTNQHNDNNFGMEVENVDRISEISTPPVNRISSVASSQISTSTNSRLSNVRENIKNNQTSNRMFMSSLSKRKSDQNFNNDDLVENSPPPNPSKKARIIFQRCFQSTFDPSTVPGYSEIYAEDSGEETE